MAMGRAGSGAAAGGLGRWGAWCALFLLAALAISFVHTASTHCEPSRDCLACRTLHAPALAPPAGGLAQPLSLDGPVIERAVAPARDASLTLERLRAPPSLSI